MDKYKTYLIFIGIYAAYLLVMSIITCILYKKDKAMAQGGGGAKRIKEKTLLGFTALGGAIGAQIGRKLFHHKTDKSYFSLTIWFSILMELALIGTIIAIMFIA